MATTPTTIAVPAQSVNHYRWLQLFFGIVCMAMVANLQYGWTLFVNPMDAKYHWGRAAIQVAFSIFVITETWLVPLEGYFVDRFGPKPVVMVGGVLVGIAWVMNAYASSLPMLYIAAAIGGIGAGAVRDVFATMLATPVALAIAGRVKKGADDRARELFV